MQNLWKSPNAYSYLVCARVSCHCELTFLDQSPRMLQGINIRVLLYSYLAVLQPLVFLPSAGPTSSDQTPPIPTQTLSDPPTARTPWPRDATVDHLALVDGELRDSTYAAIRRLRPRQGARTALVNDSQRTRYECNAPLHVLRTSPRTYA